MKKQKLTLSNLKVQSFVTSLKESESITVNGGEVDPVAGGGRTHSYDWIICPLTIGCPTPGCPTINNTNCTAGAICSWAVGC